MASNATISSGREQHGTVNNGIPIRKQTGKFRVITVGNDCWVGQGAIISGNVPDGCVIGAGAVVVDDLNTRSGIYVGSPARFIKERPKSNQYPINL